VDVPSSAPPLEPLTEPRITARCGGPATGILQQRLPEGPCGELPLTWEQIGGPPLSKTTFTGPRIDVATQETDFGALIGQSVELRVSASTVGQQRENSVLITAEPFVEVSRLTERATGTEAELLGVSLQLHNTTECGVREVIHVERLEGVDYVPGSARFNGAQVEAELMDSDLTVRGLVLEGNARGQLTYLVRPRLLEPQRFEGQSSLRGVAISQPRAEPGSGCGCSGGGSGAAAMGLAGLLMVLSRRRRR
jgi:MYXO-CTERM domain-containing protein